MESKAANLVLDDKASLVDFYIWMIDQEIAVCEKIIFIYKTIVSGSN